MAGTTGLEPATSAVTGQRSNQLSYVPRIAVGAIGLIQDPVYQTGRVSERFQRYLIGRFLIRRQRAAQRLLPRSSVTSTISLLFIGTVMSMVPSGPLCIIRSVSGRSRVKSFRCATCDGVRSLGDPISM